MKQLIKLMEYKFCNKCKVEIKDNKKYCKNCQPQTSNTKKYYSYKFENSHLVRVGQELTSTPKAQQKLKIVYYTDPRDVNLMSQVQYSRFTSLEHLSSYIIYSNRFPISQLFGEFGLNFRNFPQIQGLINKHRESIPSIKPSGLSGLEPGPKYKSLEDLFKREFWEELVKLYLLHFHLNLPVFHLNNIDIFRLPQPLLISIYCWGYVCRKRKTKQLTEYMDKLAANNVNRIMFKPSLSNAQALYIQYYNYYRRGKISEGRACISHLMRMCYSLGIHTDAQIFDFMTNYNRSNLFLNILCSQKNINTIYMVCPNYEVEIPKWNQNLFNHNHYKLPKQIRCLLNFEDREDELFSKLCSLKNRSKAVYLAQIKFPNISQLSNQQIEKLCCIKYDNLRNNYFSVLNQYEVLKSRFESRSKDLEANFEMVTLHHLQSSLLIFEYGRLKSNGININLIRRTIEICDEILGITLISNNSTNYTDINYLVAFTYLQIFKNLDNIKQLSIVSKFKAFSNNLSNNLGNYQLLQYLLFDFGFNLINK